MLQETCTGHKLPRIAVVSPTVPHDGAGGVTSAHYNIYSSLKSLGCDAKFMTFEDMKLSDFPDAIRCGASPLQKFILGASVHCFLKALGSRKPAYQLADIFLSLPGALQLRRHHRRLNPDVAIIPDHGAPGLVLSKSVSPLILVAHHIPARFINNPLLGDVCRLDVFKATALEQRVVSKVSAVVCPSEYMKREFQKTYLFAGEIVVIPNPMDESLMDSIPAHDIRVEMGLPCEAPVVYIPSAGNQFKGSRYVSEIVRRLATVYGGHLGFYLSGTIDSTLKAELKYLPPNAHLFMPGHVDFHSNISYVKSCSFGVSPTLLESFGMALLEAGSCMVPMVTFDVDGTSEVIKDGINGFLIPYLDLEGLIKSASNLFENDLCIRLSSSAAHYVRDRFSSFRIAKQYVSLIQRLTGR
ncbi:glycosyltransferase family 4 protein [Geotalea sp. SG265]|uniref:glycosyltransferase family 4 protein n=1 Tax=Geotalea sp. SG265 TaxID=2922867 RepID=UPI001FB03496|nr:glycosyltransferase family 4 protein [Geotalea sp. SG265]